MSMEQQLKYIDREIEQRRQQVNVLTLEIAKLEDHRRTTLWLEEQRLGQVPGVTLTAHQQELLTGRSERPVIAIRDASAPADQTPAERKKLRDREAYERRKAREKKEREAKPERRGGPEAAARMRAVRAGKRSSLLGEWKTKVMEYLAGTDEPATAADIANYYGLPSDEVARKPLGNAIYHLNAKGWIERAAGSPTGVGRKALYQLVEKQPNGAAAH
jgi:hypothetical protein